MKFVFTINNRKFLLTGAQTDAVVKILAEADQIEHKWLGTGKGPNGANSIDVLDRKPLSEILSVNLMSEDDFNVLKLVTASQKKD